MTQPQVGDFEVAIGVLAVIHFLGLAYSTSASLHRQVSGISDNQTFTLDYSSQQEIPQDLINSIRETLLRNSQGFFTGTSYRLVNIRQAGPWAIIGIAIPKEIVSENNTYPFRETSNILANRRDDGSWVSGLRFTDDYSVLLKLAPSSFLSDTSKRLLSKNRIEDRSLPLGDGYMGVNYFSDGLDLLSGADGFPIAAAQESPLLNGIDVSHNNIDGYGLIDWSQVYNAGNRFAFAKATEGIGWYDKKFTQNMLDARANNILIGAFDYARPDLNSPEAEASYFLDVAGGYLSNGYLRPALDLEMGSSIGWSNLSNWADTWIRTIKNATGITPILYCDSDYANHLDSLLTKYDLWIAHPYVSPELCTEMTLE